jgi:hypothetical protein
MRLYGMCPDFLAGLRRRVSTFHDEKEAKPASSHLTGHRSFIERKEHELFFYHRLVGLYAQSFVSFRAAFLVAGVNFPGEFSHF